MVPSRRRTAASSRANNPERHRLARTIAMRMLEESDPSPRVGEGETDGINDPVMAHIRDLIEISIAFYPERESAIRRATHALRQKWKEREQRMRVLLRMSGLTPQDIEVYYPNPDTYMYHTIKQYVTDLSRASYDRVDRESAEAASVLAALLITPEEEVARQESEAQLEQRDWEPIDLPRVHLKTECQNDANAAGDLVSSMSMDPLVEGETVKLSDGHCYSFQDIVRYYQSKTQSRQPFLSPFTRRLFTEEDIRKVHMLLRRGGRKRTRRVRRRRST